MKRRIDYIKESILNILEEIKPVSFVQGSEGETRLSDRDQRNAGRYLGIARRLEAGEPVKLHGFSSRMQSSGGGQELEDTPHNNRGDLAKMSVTRLQGALRAHGIAPSTDNPHDYGYGAVKRYARGQLPGNPTKSSDYSPRTSGFVGIPNTSHAAGDFAGETDSSGVKRTTIVGSDNKPVVSDEERAVGADLANRARDVINRTRIPNVAAKKAQAKITRGSVL